MNTADIKNLWVKLALSDLASSRILLKQKQYRTSYFLFQQATEKANKAFALYAGFVQESELMKVGHDQFKIYRKILSREEKELGRFITATKDLPSKIRDHEIFGYTSIQSLHQGQGQMLSLIDGLKDQDLVNISAVELNRLYKQLLSLSPRKIKLPEGIDKDLKEGMLKVADWVAHFDTPEAIAAKKEFEDFANDEKKSKELMATMVQMLKITADFAFIFITLLVCAYLTIQHSSLTRYPSKGKNPFNIYTSKLPLVKKQAFFMDLLEISLRKIGKLDQ